MKKNYFRMKIKNALMVFMLMCMSLIVGANSPPNDAQIDNQELSIVLTEVDSTVTQDVVTLNYELNKPVLIEIGIRYLPITQSTEYILNKKEEFETQLSGQVIKDNRLYNTNRSEHKTATGLRIIYDIGANTFGNPNVLIRYLIRSQGEDLQYSLMK